MGLTADQLRAGIDALAAGEPGFAAALARAGYPEPRLRDRGYATLLRTIVGQQVSVAAPASIWRKLEAQVGDLTRPEPIPHPTADQPRAAGLSRTKAAHAPTPPHELPSPRLNPATLT